MRQLRQARLPCLIAAADAPPCRRRDMPRELRILPRRIRAIAARLFRCFYAADAHAQIWRAAAFTTLRAFHFRHSPSPADRPDMAAGPARACTPFAMPRFQPPFHRFTP